MSFAPSTARAGWRVAWKLALVVLLIVAGHHLAAALADSLSFEIRPRNEDLVHRAIMSAAAGYVILLAIPFMPAVEVGLAMIGLLGAKIAPLVYLCTVTGLFASYVVGRVIPPARLHAFVRNRGFDRAARLLETVGPMSVDERLAHLIRRAPRRWVPALLRHRHLALAVALNLPGNFLLGGGGGIALVAGLSRLYSTAGFLVVVALAVLPVPLAVLFFGVEILGD